MSSAPPRRPASGLKRFLEDSSFLRQYLWKYRRAVGVGLLALIVVDILETLPPIFLKEAVDVAVEGGPRERLAWIALAYAATALVQGVCRYAWRMYLIRSSMRSGRDMRRRYSGHLFGLGMSFFDRRRVGDLMSLATSDVEAVRMAIGPGLLTLADALFYFLTVPVAMFLLSPELTLLAFIPLPLIPWFVIRNQRRVHERFEKVQAAFARLAAMAQENLNGVRVVKGFAREDAQLARFRQAGEEYIRLNLSLARVQTAFGPTLDFVMSLGLVLLLFVGGRWAIDDAVSIGTFVAFQRYIQKMIWPMTAVGLAVTYYQRSVASSGRLKEVLAISTDVPEPELPARRAPAGVRRGAVEFRDLTFRFPGSGADALQGIRLSIEPGERVAFVGAIGSGKSALLSLLPRLYPVGRGMLYVEGVDVNDWPLEELRSRIGYVSQEVFLFGDTVRENLGFGLPEQTGSDDLRIERAARLAGVHDEVLGFGEGYLTRLGERGVNLSGGQKQRLTIARALVRDPAILILDDALASVDVQTERTVLANLASRPEGNTELIAAHRISTVKEVDRIVVLASGRVAEQGTHRELIRIGGGLYARFYEQQRLREEVEQYVRDLDREEPPAGQRPELGGS